MRVGLLGCGKQKLDHAAPAAELYCGSYFRLCRTWLEQQGLDAWGILSAEHGLVLPEQVLEPYDVALGQLDAGARRSWAISTRCQLQAQWPEARYLVLAGAPYRAALAGLPADDVLAAWGHEERQAGRRMGIGAIKKRLISEIFPA